MLMTKLMTFGLASVASAAPSAPFCLPSSVPCHFSCGILELLPAVAHHNIRTAIAAHEAGQEDCGAQYGHQGAEHDQPQGGQLLPAEERMRFHLYVGQAGQYISQGNGSQETLQICIC